jgi:hypothetical protein
MAITAGYATIGCLHGNCRRSVEIDHDQRKAIICKDKRCKIWLNDLEEFNKVESINLHQIAKDYFTDIERYEASKEYQQALDEFLFARDTKREQLAVYTRLQQKKKQALANQALVSYVDAADKEITRLDEEMRKPKRQRMDDLEVHEHQVDELPLRLPDTIQIHIKKALLGYIRNIDGTTIQDFVDLVTIHPYIDNFGDLNELWETRDEYGVTPMEYCENNERSPIL